MIPILDLKRQIAPIRREIDKAIKRVVDSANFVFGSEINDFENAVNKYCGVKYSVAVSNGTDAIRLGLIALGVGLGDKVICPAFTYYATAAAVSSLGAIPVFADIDYDTYAISLKSIEGILRKNKKNKIKAIIPVHLFGQCADMDGILWISQKYHLKVIEDVAQAFGAEYKGRKAGTFGDCGALSFFPGKNLGAFGDAGMVLTNDRIVDEKLRLLRNQGCKEKYNHLIIGYNHRMDTMQALILNVKLKYYDSWNRRRQAIAEYFNDQFRGLDINIPFTPQYNTHIYHQYVLRIKRSNRKIVKFLRNKGIDARVYYPVPLHLQKSFKYLGYKKGDFPVSENAAHQVFAVPVYPDLKKEEISYIAKTVKEFLN